MTAEQETRGGETPGGWQVATPAKLAAMEKLKELTAALKGDTG